MNSDQTGEQVTGGRRLEVMTLAGELQEIFLREASIGMILSGQYVEVLRQDYGRLLELLCDQPAGWSGTLTRDSWTRLREAEEQLNFGFALGELQVAVDRGRQMEFLDKEVQQRIGTVLGTLKDMGLLSDSPAAMQPSPDAPERKS